MVNESFTFGLSTLVTVVGLVTMLYGVSLTAGQSLNAIALGGGGLVLAAISVHTLALMSIDAGHGGESDH